MVVAWNLYLVSLWKDKIVKKKKAAAAAATTTATATLDILTYRMWRWDGMTASRHSVVGTGQKAILKLLVLHCDEDHIKAVIGMTMMADLGRNM